MYDDDVMRYRYQMAKSLSLEQLKAEHRPLIAAPVLSVHVCGREGRRKREKREQMEGEKGGGAGRERE